MVFNILSCQMAGSSYKILLLVTPLALHRMFLTILKNHPKQVYLPCTDNHWHHRLCSMEMDLHNNNWVYALCHFPWGESEPTFFCTVVFLFLMQDNLKLTYFFYEVPCFSSGCKTYGNQTSLISPTCRIKWSFKAPFKSPKKVVFARGPHPRGWPMIGA